MTFPDTTFTTGTTITSEWLNAVNDRCQEKYNVQDFGATGDGITDDSPAIQACIDAVLALGGGTVWFPKGTYKLETGLIGGSNIELQCEIGVIFEGTDLPDSTPAISFSGSIGENILLGVNAGRGDKSLTTATPHGLQAGDWIFLMSQRACLHQDAGPQWQLGNPTGVSWYKNVAFDAGDSIVPKLPNGLQYRAVNSGTSGSTEPVWPTTIGGTVVDNTIVWECYAVSNFMPFFAEPLQVKAVTSPTTFTLMTSIIYPSYRINRDEETYISDRVSTIQKITFCENPKVSGNPTFIVRGKSSSILGYGVGFKWCYQPEIEAEFDLGIYASEGMHFMRCYYGSAKVKAFRPIGWSIIGSHAGYNSFRDQMSWWCNWYYEDYYGSQGLDVTYGGGDYPYNTSIQPTISGKAYAPLETGLTFHSGCFGGNVTDFSVVNCPSTGIYNRSRFVTITNFYGISGNTTGGRGIALGSWSTDCVVSNFNINGFEYGIQIEIDNEQGVCAPHNRNTSLLNGSIANSYCGIRLVVPSGDGAVSGDPCNVNISNVKFNNNQIFHIWIDNYWNYGRVSNCSFGPLIKADGTVTTGRQAIVVQGNAVAWTFENLDFINLGALNNGIGPGYSITDTTTFPVADFPWPRHKVLTDTFNVVGDINEVYNTPTIGYYRPTTSFTLPQWCSGDTIMCYSGTDMTVTIPTDTVNIPIGSTVTLIQEGAGHIILSPASGITIIAKGNNTVNTGDFITLTKLQTNRWTAVGDLS